MRSHRSKKPAVPHRIRRLRLESLEQRRYLASDLKSDLGSDGAGLDPSIVDQVDFAAGDLLLDDSPSPPYAAARHNPVNPADVDLSGDVSPLDALLVINHLNYGDPSLTSAESGSAPGEFDTDVNGDGQLTAADVDAVMAALDDVPV